MALKQAKAGENIDDVLLLIGRIFAENGTGVTPFADFVVFANKLGEQVACHWQDSSSKQVAVKDFKLTHYHI